MPTITGTTSTDVALSLRTTYTTPLLANIAAGKDITAADINNLATFTGLILNHTHTFTEYTAIHEYGNTNSTVTVAGTTTAPLEDVFSWPSVSSGQVIEAASYSKLRLAANGLISHHHQFTDSY